MSTKKQQARGPLGNTFETGRELLKDAGSSFAEGIHEDILGQLLGLDFGKKSSDSHHAGQEAPPFNGKHGEIVDFTKLKHTEAKTKHEHANKKEKAPGINYLAEIHERKVSKLELREISTRVDEIMSELRKLISSSKILQVQFSESAVEQPPAEVGVYHVNFFEWLLSVIKVARQRVEDSSMWLNTINQKSSKKKSYWGMFKTHGTTFGLSNERAVATQTG